MVHIWIVRFEYRLVGYIVEDLCIINSYIVLNGTYDYKFQLNYVILVVISAIH